MPSRWWGRAGTLADAGGSATAGTMSEENGAHGRCHVYTSQRLISPEWVALSPWHRAPALPTIFLLRMTKIIWRQENNNVRSEESGFPRHGYQCPHSQWLSERWRRRQQQARSCAIRAFDRATEAHSGRVLCDRREPAAI